jgi:hypothetical protein
MKIVEYYIRYAIEKGIEDLRKNPYIIDEVFGELACQPLATVFGANMIEQIRCFFMDNDIPVRAVFSQNQIDLPLITVHLVSSQEAIEYKALQDHIGFKRVPKEPTVILGPFYGVTYDSTTGRLTLPKTMDLTQFIAGRKIYSAEDDAIYTVTGTMQVNQSGTPPQELQDQWIHIVTADGSVAERVQIARLTLLSSVDFYLKRIAGSWFREVFEVRCNAQTHHDQAVWLYYITSYILMRNKYLFETLGLESQTFGGSDFSRDLGKMPNNIWGRTIRLTFMVQHTWTEDIDALELVGVNLNAENPITNEIIQLGEEYGA